MELICLNIYLLNTEFCKTYKNNNTDPVFRKVYRFPGHRKGLVGTHCHPGAPSILRLRSHGPPGVSNNVRFYVGNFPAGNGRDHLCFSETSGFPTLRPRLRWGARLGNRSRLRPPDLRGRASGVQGSSSPARGERRGAGPGAFPDLPNAGLSLKFSFESAFRVPSPSGLTHLPSRRPRLPGAPLRPSPRGGPAPVYLGPEGPAARPPPADL